MKHLAAYLLLTLGGNTEPSANDIKEVLASVGIEADEDRLAHLLTELQGRDFDELITEGTAKLATVGGPSANATGHGPGDSDTKAEPGDESPDENSLGESEEDEDEDFGLGLFG
ncbi:60s acidic ribosomal protein-domain-containing protein [Aspergillus multicolor]|uniref:60S acidic ribosomal protein P2 n=1 Tax=Aspergillus multicolor TaxID=41759 RepID=UPI003CCDB61E